jgi:outer membrane protein W
MKEDETVCTYSRDRKVKNKYSVALEIQTEYIRRKHWCRWRDISKMDLKMKMVYENGLFKWLRVDPMSCKFY